MVLAMLRSVLKPLRGARAGAARSRLAIPLGSAPGVVTATPEGRVLYANAAAAAFLGNGCAPGADLTMLVASAVEPQPGDPKTPALGDPSAPAAFAMALRHPAAAAERPLRLAIRAIDGSGKPRVLDIHVDDAPAAHFGRAPRRSVILLDRGEETAREGALRAALARARAEAEAAREDARRRADLLADLGHEMRTPLNAVIGFAGAMRNETFGPLGHDKYDEYAGYIATSGGHLLDLVSSILDLAKIEAERFVLKPQMTDLAALARDCAAMVRGAADEAGLALRVQIAGDLPQSYIDPRAARQILINLLSNAVKFTSDGEVRLSLASEDESLVAIIEDTGVGMSEAELARLGARFTAAQGPGVRGAKGAGLGLALAYALAEAQGGGLRIESAPGEGVKATVRLPIIAAPARLKRQEFAADGTADITAEETAAAPAPADAPVQSQLDRIEAYRRELIAARRAAA